MTTIQEAAQARAAAMRAAADRPSSRRSAEQAGTKPLVRAASEMTLRASDDGDGFLHFHGCASVTGIGYEMWDMFGPYTELVSPGAFKKTLADPELEVPLVLQHDPMRRLARTKNATLTLAEDDQGLQVDAPRLDATDPDVAYIAPKLRSGLIDEMSFRFTITAGQWSPDWMEFHIDEVDINRGDVAIVGYGANPYTSGELRAALVRMQTKRNLDPEDVSVLTQVLGWLSAIDNIVDEGQETLAAYLQIPNPDDDDVTDPAELAARTALRQLAPKPRASLITDDDVRPRVIPGLS